MLGTTGRTGNVFGQDGTTCHLDFMVVQDDVPINPYHYLKNEGRWLTMSEYEESWGSMYGRLINGYYGCMNFSDVEEDASFCKYLKL